MRHVIKVFYNLVLSVCVVLAIPFILVAVCVSEKRRLTLLPRLGMQSFKSVPAKRPVWVHALSVGEVLSIIPLVKSLGRYEKVVPLVFSASTLTGYRVAKQALGDSVAAVFFFPYDLIWCVKRVITRVNPCLFVLVESDLWPNFLWELKRKSVAAVIVNGRLSRSSLAGYRRIFILMKPVFSAVAAICVQSELDRDRYRQLGIPDKKLIVTGNMKFDCSSIDTSFADKEQMRKEMSIPIAGKVFVAGSTHDGEEAVLADVFIRLKELIDNLTLVVVPRDPKRAHAVSRLFLSRGFSCRILSSLMQEDPGAPDLGGSSNVCDVVVVSVMGLLAMVYSVADLTFVGGSLVNEGGHNPVEPAALGKPVLFGPHMDDFEPLAKMFVASGGAAQVQDAEALFSAAQLLLADDEKARGMGLKALQAVSNNKGAVEATIRVIERFL